MMVVFHRLVECRQGLDWLTGCLGYNTFPLFLRSRFEQGHFFAVVPRVPNAHGGAVAFLWKIPLPLNLLLYIKPFMNVITIMYSLQTLQAQFLLSSNLGLHFTVPASGGVSVFAESVWFMCVFIYCSDVVHFYISYSWLAIRLPPPPSAPIGVHFAAVGVDQDSNTFSLRGAINFTSFTRISCESSRGVVRSAGFAEFIWQQLN